jgi:6,7-dimethyl-8-ribityllumazine synthase
MTPSRPRRAPVPDRARDARGADAPRVVEGGSDGTGLRIGIAVSRFNPSIGERLLEGALETLGAQGVRTEDITVAWVPGAFELPLLARRLAEGRDAVVCLGAVIRGQTPHFDYVAGAAARGIARAGEEREVPVLFGVLTTNTMRQALERSGGRLGNRGADAARAAIETASLLRLLGA